MKTAPRSAARECPLSQPIPALHVGVKQSQSGVTFLAYTLMSSGATVIALCAVMASLLVWLPEHIHAIPCTAMSKQHKLSTSRQDLLFTQANMLPLLLLLSDQSLFADHFWAAPHSKQHCSLAAHPLPAVTNQSDALCAGHFGPHPSGTVGGIQAGVDTTHAGKVWLVFNALGAIAFAFSFSFILVSSSQSLCAADCHLWSASGAPGSGSSMHVAVLHTCCPASMSAVQDACTAPHESDMLAHLTSCASCLRTREVRKSGTCYWLGTTCCLAAF